MTQYAQRDAVTLPAEPTSAALAREHLGGILARCPPERRQIGQLLASELVANAVRHGAGPIRLAATVTGQRLHCEVEDRGSGQPTPQDPQPAVEGGRGLLIVDRLADSWGVMPSAAVGGKTVCFDLDLE